MAYPSAIMRYTGGFLFFLLIWAQDNKCLCSLGATDFLSFFHVQTFDI